MFPISSLSGLNAFILQWKSPHYIRRYQEKRLRYIVRYAYENSHFYRNKFRECGITPLDIHTLEDLRKIPTVTKAELRKNFPQVISKGFTEETCTTESTSGSTGERIKILHDDNALVRYGVNLLRGHMALGLKPYHKTAYVRYKPVNPNPLEKMGFFKFYHIFSDLAPGIIIKKLKEISPFTINCYPTVMYLLAKQILDEDVRFLSPHHIVTWSEKLTPRVRETVEEKFGCPVYDQYGAYEFHSVAFECQRKRMHINADTLIMEFLKNGEPVSPGERGEIVMTNLWNRAMPFIRYEIGDIGAFSDDICECGRGLPLIDELEGRIEDSCQTITGEVVLPSRVITLFYPYEEIDAFQVIQRKRDEVRIKVVRGDSYSQKIENEICEKFKSIFGEGSTIKMDYVKEIEKKEGKQRVVICEV
ncbi:MAG: phenylacetate--CoA ligase family protein [Theionarchaea archaeon]|nr:phenylacetate--CoA ligase family protein [Theionarchaea archaeon]